MSEGSQTAKDIAMGRLDDELHDIVQAVGQRAAAINADVRWRLTLDDLCIDEENLTLLELERVEELTGKSWLTLEPRRKASHMVAFLQAALEARAGMSAVDARARLAELTTKQVADEVLTEYVVQPAPFDSPSESSS